jgi:N-acetylglucosamine-6-sulfatase
VLIAAAAGLGMGALAIAGSSGPSPAAVDQASAAANGRPNVLVIESDDQTVESMRVMSKVNSLIAARGATFDNNFVNFSLCCPSRSTFLTGQYMHNHGVTGNGGPTGGFHHFEELHAHNNLAVWLKRAGYYTGLIGKYLNGYQNNPLVPPGWSDWHAAQPATQNVYDYTINDNGALHTHGHDPADFKQDVLTSKAIDFVHRRAPAAKPFFLWLTYTAPHGGGPNPNPNPPTDCADTAKPAPRHAHAFDSEPLPQPPNFNEADVSDKPQQIQNLPLLDGAAIANVTRRYRCRLESLLSVDEGVKKVIDALKAEGSLKNTYVIYTSDNGFFHGEHRIPQGKQHIYEESIRVPLVMRGPGIPHGVNVRDLSINADLAPTIVDAAAAKPKLVMDGRSLLPFAKQPSVERGRELLIEQPTFAAIHTQRYMYAEFTTGERELYDLKTDPYELGSVHADPAYATIRQSLARRLHKLEQCKGASCRLRPRLKLGLHYPTGKRGGRRCAQKPIRADVHGADAGKIVRVRFYVAGQHVADKSAPPFTRTLPYGLFRGKTKVRARASLQDGRRMTIDRRVRSCG